MKTTSPNEEIMRYDIIIIASYILFAVSFFFEKEYNTISIIAGVLYAYLFTKCIRTTSKSSKSIRLKSLEYALSFMVAFSCGLKMTGLLTDLRLGVKPLGVALTGLSLQSLYFMVVNKNFKSNPRS